MPNGGLVPAEQRESTAPVPNTDTVPEGEEVAENADENKDTNKTGDEVTDTRVETAPKVDEAPTDTTQNGGQ